MKIILLEDVKNCGRKGQVKHVSDGYARNYLLPNNLATLATYSALDSLEEEMRQREMEANQELMAVQKLAEEVENLNVYIRAAVDENGTLYGGITKHDIQQAIKDMNFTVDESAIMIDKPIKNTGEHPVTLQFDQGLEAQITVIVEAEDE